jgi:hypothetical protein
MKTSFDEKGSKPLLEMNDVRAPIHACQPGGPAGGRGSSGSGARSAAGADA